MYEHYKEMSRAAGEQGSQREVIEEKPFGQ